jgi:uncharacterized protein YkwD
MRAKQIIVVISIMTLLFNGCGNRTRMLGTTPDNIPYEDLKTEDKKNEEEEEPLQKKSDEKTVVEEINKDSGKEQSKTEPSPAASPSQAYVSTPKPTPSSIHKPKPSPETSAPAATPKPSVSDTPKLTDTEAPIPTAAATPKPTSSPTPLPSNPVITVDITKDITNGLSDAEVAYLKDLYPRKKLPALPNTYQFKFMSEVEHNVFLLVNKERAKAGANALAWDKNLNSVARYKSANMLQYNDFGHPTKSLGGIAPIVLAISYFGYYTKSFGENIFMSSGRSEAEVTAELLMNGWMNSPGHRNNLLNPEWTRMTCGIVFSSEGNKAYATQHFTK